MLVYVHTTRIYVRFIRRKQLLVTAWYAAMSYGAESACSRDLLRSIILHDIYISYILDFRGSILNFSFFFK